MCCAFPKREQSPLASRGACWRTERPLPPSERRPSRLLQAAANRDWLAKGRRGLGTGAPTGALRGGEGPTLGSAGRLRPLKLVAPARPAARQAVDVWWQRTATGNGKLSSTPRRATVAATKEKTARGLRHWRIRAGEGGHFAPGAARGEAAGGEKGRNHPGYCPGRNRRSGWSTVRSLRGAHQKSAGASSAGLFR